MTDSARLLEARIALHAATQAGMQVYRDGRIQVVGYAPPPGQHDPNVAIVDRLADYRQEIEHLLPNPGDKAADLPAPALAGMTIP